MITDNRLEGLAQRIRMNMEDKLDDKNRLE